MFKALKHANHIMEVKQKKLMHTYSHNAITHQKNGSYSSTTATLHAGSIRKKSQLSDFVMLIIKQAPRFLTAVEDGIIPYSIFLVSLYLFSESSSEIHAYTYATQSVTFSHSVCVWWVCKLMGFECIFLWKRGKR